MIAQLTGQVIAHDERTMTIDVHGVAFRLFVLPRALAKFPIGSQAIVLTYLQVREDALELYGFIDQAEQRLFEKLLSVSGVGPKMALSVLSAASVEDLEAAIGRGQAALLTKVSGVGTKTAERIIVDLRGKLSYEETGVDSALSTVIDALINLGYSSREARTAAAATASDLPIAQRVKQALKRIDK